MTRRGLLLLWIGGILCLVAGTGLVTALALDALVGPLFKAPTFVQTPGKPGCRLPGDDEQLVITVRKRGGELVVQCTYLHSRGAARKAVAL